MKRYIYMKKQITVIGSLNYDMILKVKRLPYEGETMAAEGISTAAGGKGSNQAAQAAKLGVPTYLIGAVGNDSMGEFLIAEAKNTASSQIVSKSRTALPASVLSTRWMTAVFTPPSFAVPIMP